MVLYLGNSPIMSKLQLLDTETNPKRDRPKKPKVSIYDSVHNMKTKYKDTATYTK